LTYKFSAFAVAK